MSTVGSLLYPAPIAGALSDDARLTSVAYIGPKSRTESPRKTKLGTEVAHVTDNLLYFAILRVSINDIFSHVTTLKVKGQLAGGGAYCVCLPTACFIL